MSKKWILFKCEQNWKWNSLQISKLRSSWRMRLNGKQNGCPNQISGLVWFTDADPGSLIQGWYLCEFCWDNIKTEGKRSSCMLRSFWGVKLWYWSLDFPSLSKIMEWILIIAFPKFTNQLSPSSSPRVEGVAVGRGLGKIPPHGNQEGARQFSSASLTKCV